MESLNGAGVHVILKTCNTKAYFVSPADHAGAIVTGIVLLHDCFGPHTPYCYTFADCISEQGYKVIVPELHNDDKIWANSLIEEKLHIWKNRLSEENILNIYNIIQESYDYLINEQSIQKIACIGIGWGGEISLEYSMNKKTPFHCCIALSPTFIKFPENENENENESENDLPCRIQTPTLCILGNQQKFISQQELNKLYLTGGKQEDGMLLIKIYHDQGHGFGYCNIINEDASTQAIAQVLDWLQIHLHQFKVSYSTSDTDPYWPQGRNGPFFNVGLQHWQQARNQWKIKTQDRPPRPPPVALNAIVDDLTSVQRTVELPGRMTLPDIVEVLVDIWDV